MMRQLIGIFFLLLIIPFNNVKSQDSVHKESTFSTENSNYFLHTVERGQTVYSIATMYNVSIEDIYRLNPESREVIKIDEQLRIPQESGSYYYHTIQPKETLYSVSRLYQMRGEDIVDVNPGLSVETFTIGKIIRIPTNRVTTPIEKGNEKKIQDEVNNLLTQKQQGVELDVIRVALLLPFGLKDGTTPQNAANNRYVEYYEGFLLALNDLKKKGVNVDLQVYDTGLKDDKIFPIIDKPEMQQIDLLIGGQNDKQIKILSNFSNAKQIPYIIPIVRSDEVLTNYYSYQVNTPQSYIYSKTSLAFYDKNKNENIIFFLPKEKGNKMDLVNIMKQDLDAKRVNYHTVTNANALATSMSSSKKNIFVVGDDTKETLLALTNAVNKVLETNNSYEVSLFGHPKWQEYTVVFADNFYSLNATFYTTVYANPTSSSVKNFYKKYSRWYSRELLNYFPKYGILGYDTGMYFIQLLDKYGTSYDANVNGLSYRGIQTDFYFERINNWGGFINMNVFWVEFKPDHTIKSNPIK